MRSLIPDHQILECKINLIHQQIFMGILDHRKILHKVKTKILQHKTFTMPKFPDLQYVCVCTTWKGLCMSYLEDGMCVHVSCVFNVVCICVCASYMVVVCVCVHTYTCITFRYNPHALSNFHSTHFFKIVQFTLSKCDHS